MIYLVPDDTDSSLIVSFDAVMAEGHESTVEVTDHPVESGSVITDHVRANPITLSLEAYVTNTPIKDLGRGRVSVIDLDVPRYNPPLTTPGALFNAALSAVTGLLSRPVPTQVQVLHFDESFDRVKEVYLQLTELCRRGAVLSVFTSVETYESMVLTKVSFPRTEPASGTFNLDFRQVRTVSTASVDAPRPVEKRGEGKVSKGSQSTKGTGAKDGEKATSLLNKALNALGVSL